jgi:hypothetical protein
LLYNAQKLILPVLLDVMTHDRECVKHMSALITLFHCRQSIDILLAAKVGEDPQPLGTSSSHSISGGGSPFVPK